MYPELLKEEHRRADSLQLSMNPTSLSYTLQVPGPSGCAEFQPLRLEQRISDLLLDFRPLTKNSPGDFLEIVRLMHVYLTGSAMLKLCHA